jgi:hypothetical protein
VSTTPAINEKIFETESFLVFSGDAAGLLFTLMISYLMFPVRCRQADIVATVSLPVSLLPAKNLLSVSLNR